VIPGCTHNQGQEAHNQEGCQDHQSNQEDGNQDHQVRQDSQEEHDNGSAAQEAPHKGRKAGLHATACPVESHLGIQQLLLQTAQGGAPAAKRAKKATTFAASTATPSSSRPALKRHMSLGTVDKECPIQGTILNVRHALMDCASHALIRRSASQVGTTIYDCHLSFIDLSINSDKYECNLVRHPSPLLTGCVRRFYKIQVVQDSSNQFYTFTHWVHYAHPRKHHTLLMLVVHRAARVRRDRTSSSDRLRHSRLPLMCLRTNSRTKPARPGAQGCDHRVCALRRIC
jgi:hypothetical protein